MTILVLRAEFPGLQTIQLTYVISIDSRKLLLTSNNCQLRKMLRFINVRPYNATTCSYLRTYTCLISPIFAVQRTPLCNAQRIYHLC